MTRPRRTAVPPRDRQTSSVRIERRRGWVLVLTLLAFMCVTATPVRTTSNTSTINSPDRDAEYKVKAAFLYNFIRFTKWPKSSFERSDSPIVVLVVGRDPFGKHLEQALKGKVIGGRKVLLQSTKSVPDKVTAHIVYEGGLSSKEQKKLLEACRNKPVLLCGERDGYASLGAQCNFYVDGSRIRFEINKSAVDRSSLEISSELLKLARIVKDAK